MENLKNYWLEYFNTNHQNDDWWKRKKELYKERNAEIVKISGDGQIARKVKYNGATNYEYLLYLSFLVKQGDQFYLEERVTPYQFSLKNGDITDHQEVPIQFSDQNNETDSIQFDQEEDEGLQRFTYDRLKAVQYAERWWNSYNPAYRQFNVDCTNFVSQCLRAGGAPMWGAPVRDRGWWYQGDNWSYSWAVAHSLRWYLSGSTKGLQGREVESASELYPGDIICYDFQGDGRWDHNTIVVTKDAYDMPLVNAHTDNSKHRYWSYEDSTAWTPNIKYKFFRIGES